MEPLTEGARYAFRIEVRLSPASDALSVDPDTFETTVFRRADPPGDDGWTYFQLHCWRGDLADEVHFRQQLAPALGVDVERAAFSELQTTPEYFAALKSAIADDLERFNATSVSEVLSKYLGSSIRVVETE